MTREESWPRWECEICGGGPSHELTQCDECRRWICPACLVEREDTFGKWIECNECHKEDRTMDTRIYQLTRDGKEVMRGNEGECWRYIHNNHGYSVDWALKYEGFRLEPLEKENEK